MKVITVVGTRPEIIRLSRTMAALDKEVEHTVIHTGQNFDYELNEIFFEGMSIRKPDVILNIRASHPAEFVGNAMMLLGYPLETIRPDAVLILGDTNSAFAAAYASKRLKIPVFHMESGNRCFDQRVPEEINRKAVDHLSDINLPYSSIARENLLREGFPADRIIKTGSPMHEILHYYQSAIFDSRILETLALSYRDYFVVSVHREENTIPEKLDEFRGMLIALASKYGKRVIVSTHPRLRKELEKSTSDLYDVMGYQSTLGAISGVEFHKPFGFCDYVKLQQNAICTLSDSGTITEESSLLGFPALNLRETHERQEGMEEVV